MLEQSENYQKLSEEKKQKTTTKQENVQCIDGIFIILMDKCLENFVTKMAWKLFEPLYIVRRGLFSICLVWFSRFWQFLACNDYLVLFFIGLGVLSDWKWQKDRWLNDLKYNNHDSKNLETSPWHDGLIGASFFSTESFFLKWSSRSFSSFSCWSSLAVLPCVHQLWDHCTWCKQCGMSWFLHVALQTAQSVLGQMKLCQT